MNEAKQQTGITLDTPVPFGKHRGQPMAVLLADTGYIQWMMSQASFDDKYPNIMNYLRNGPTEQGDCTPEHNSLQMRFMDPAYCARFAAAICNPNRKECGERHHSLGYEAGGVSHTAAFRGRGKDGNERHVWSKISDTGNRFKASNAYYKVSEAEYESLTVVRCDSKKPWGTEASVSSYEWHNWDLLLVGSQKCPDCGVPRDSSVVMAVELKPTIGEDYPAILRKVKQRRAETSARAKNESILMYYGHPHVVVFTDSYTGKSASWEQVREMFRLSNVTLLQSSELPGAA